VEALRVRRVLPRLGVAGAEEFGDGEAGDGAAAVPVFPERLAEEALADALSDDGLGLCRAGLPAALLEAPPGWRPRRVQEDADAAERVVQLGERARTRGAHGAGRERDVGPGHGPELRRRDPGPEREERAPPDRHHPHMPLDPAHADARPLGIFAEDEIETGVFDGFADQGW